MRQSSVVLSESSAKRVQIKTFGEYGVVKCWHISVVRLRVTDESVILGCKAKHAAVQVTFNGILIDNDNLLTASS